ncbi:MULTISPECIES: hypothetical protein [Olleya]|uniref:Uncharacterized protein n=1 Tax=Olleya marilimosa TaxID=272164 RepID=A0ABR8LYD8_9FLAO|nr:MULTISPECIES: hypothetical protein [Olleya]MBD3863273.1 hypothetical protein [Olleya marilimosa]
MKSTFYKGLEYENYEYIKDDFKTIFGLKLLRNIVLQYNGDILSGMIFELDLKDLDSLIEKLNDYLYCERKLVRDKFVLGQTFTVFNFKEISLTLDIEEGIKLGVLKNLGQT